MQSEVLALLERLPRLSECSAALTACRNAMIGSLEAGGTLFVCGNGGSAADAEHIAGELLKEFLLPHGQDTALAERLTNDFGEAGEYLSAHLRRGLRVIALTGHPALATAMANDVAADLVFAQQLAVLGRAGDVLLAISTSGQSGNVCHAARVAVAKGMTALALTGQDGGALAQICRHSICVPATETALIQELHLPVYHWLCASLENYFFG